MTGANVSLAARIGALALALGVLSSLMYYLNSAGFRFLIKAVLSGGRNLMVGA